MREPIAKKDEAKPGNQKHPLDQEGGKTMAPPALNLTAGDDIYNGGDVPGGNPPALGAVDRYKKDLEEYQILVELHQGHLAEMDSQKGDVNKFLQLKKREELLLADLKKRKLKLAESRAQLDLQSRHLVADVMAGNTPEIPKGVLAGEKTAGKPNQAAPATSMKMVTYQKYLQDLAKVRSEIKKVDYEIGAQQDTAGKKAQHLAVLRRKETRIVGEMQRVLPEIPEFKKAQAYQSGIAALPKVEDQKAPVQRSELLKTFHYKRQRLLFAKTELPKWKESDANKFRKQQMIDLYRGEIKKLKAELEAMAPDIPEVRNAYLQDLHARKAALLKEMGGVRVAGAGDSHASIPDAKGDRLHQQNRLKMLREAIQDMESPSVTPERVREIQMQFKLGGKSTMSMDHQGAGSEGESSTYLAIADGVFTKHDQQRTKSGHSSIYTETDMETGEVRELVDSKATTNSPLGMSRTTVTTDSEMTTNPEGKKKGASTVTTAKWDRTGYQNTKEEVELDETEKAGKPIFRGKLGKPIPESGSLTKTSRTVGVKRGDGMLSGEFKYNKQTGDVRRDKDTDEAKLNSGREFDFAGKGSVLLDKDKAGVEGNASVTPAKLHGNSGGSFTPKFNFGGKVLVSLKDLGGDPKTFAVTVTAVGTVGGSLGLGKEKRNGGLRGKGDVTAGGESSSSYSHTRRLREDEVKTYLNEAELAASGKGSSQFSDLDRIAAFYRNGAGSIDSLKASLASPEFLASRAANMKDGESFQIDKNKKGFAGASASGHGLSASAELSTGTESSLQLSKSGGFISLATSFASNKGAKGSVGYDAKHVSGAIEGEATTKEGVALKVLIPETHAQLQDIIQACAAADTPEKLRAVVRQFQGVRIITGRVMGSSSGTGASISVAEDRAKIDYKGSGEVEATLYDDGSGTFSGKNKAGGGVSVLQNRVGAERTEGLDLDVDNKGDVTGDLYTEKSETSLGKTIGKLGHNVSRNVGSLVLNAASWLEEAKNRKGTLLGTKQIDIIIYSAIKGNSYQHFSSPRLLKQWGACVEKIETIGDQWTQSKAEIEQAYRQIAALEQGLDPKDEKAMAAAQEKAAPILEAMKAAGKRLGHARLVASAALSEFMGNRKITGGGDEKGSSYSKAIHDASLLPAEAEAGLSLLQALADSSGDLGGRTEGLESILSEAGVPNAGFLYEFPDPIKHLRSEYEGLVRLNLDAQFAAANAAPNPGNAKQALIDKLDPQARKLLHAITSTDSKQFEDPKRKQAMVAFLLRFIARMEQQLYMLKHPNAAPVDKEANAQKLRFESSLKICQSNKEEETRLLAQLVQHNAAGVRTANETATQVELSNKLRDMYKEWDLHYAEMKSLHEAYRLGGEAFDPGQFQPDRARFVSASQGSTTDQVEANILNQSTRNADAAVSGLIRETRREQAEAARRAEQERLARQRAAVQKQLASLKAKSQEAVNAKSMANAISTRRKAGEHVPTDPRADRAWGQGFMTDTKARAALVDFKQRAYSVDTATMEKMAQAVIALFDKAIQHLNRGDQLHQFGG